MVNWKEKRFYVQRLRARKQPLDNSTGIDRIFIMDYMGSAEFEWGALPRALDRIRDMPRPVPREIKSGKHTVWYVGPDDWFDRAKYILNDQIQPSDSRTLRFHEVSMIRETLIGCDWRKGAKTDFAGWWDIINDWVMFTTEEHARSWVEAVWGTLGMVEKVRRAIRRQVKAK